MTTKDNLHLACVLAGSPTYLSTLPRGIERKRVAADFRWWVLWSRYEEMVSGKCDTLLSASNDLFWTLLLLFS